MSDSAPCYEHLCKQINDLSSELLAVVVRRSPMESATAITALAAALAQTCAAAGQPIDRIVARLLLCHTDDNVSVAQELLVSVAAEAAELDASATAPY